LQQPDGRRFSSIFGRGIDTKTSVAIAEANAQLSNIRLENNIYRQAKFSPTLISPHFGHQADTIKYFIRFIDAVAGGRQSSHKAGPKDRPELGERRGGFAIFRKPAESRIDNEACSEPANS